MDKDILQIKKEIDDTFATLSKIGGYTQRLVGNIMNADEKSLSDEADFIVLRIVYYINVYRGTSDQIEVNKKRLVQWAKENSMENDREAKEYIKLIDEQLETVFAELSILETWQHEIETVGPVRSQNEYDEMAEKLKAFQDRIRGGKTQIAS